MTHSTSWRAVGSRWPWIVVMTLVGVGAAFVLLAGATPRYDTRAEVLLEAPAGQELGAREAGSYALVLGGDPLVRAAADALETEAPEPADVRSSLVPGTTVAQVTVRDASAANGEQLTAQLTQEFLAWLEDNQADREPGERVGATVLDPGTAGTEAVEPRQTPFLLVGALVGLVLGLLLARWRQVADRGVTSAEDLQESAGTAVLGSIAHDRHAPDTPLLTDLPPGHPRAESMRILRTNLEYADVDSACRIITVTSCLEDEGKTTTAANLAISLAQAGREVALVDGDLRRPRVAELFGTEGGVGLTTVLVRRVGIDEAVQPTPLPGLDVLAAGARPPNPAEIVQTEAMSALLDQLRDFYDVVVIDSPPLLPVADAALLAAKSDGALLVVRHGRTGHDQVRAARERLDHVGARLLGTVISMAPRRASARYGYGYEYDEGTARGRRKA